MEYGLIGERLGHSFSKVIHESFGLYSYELCEIEKDKLDGFMQKKDFKGINVTIPYKEQVIPYLDFISDEAKAIGAVNTVVQKNGKLYGYNTDFYGMKALIEKEKINILGKTVAILGTGGTSKTAYAVLSSLGALKIVKVSRQEREDTITYDKLYEIADGIDVIINTTPVGMYPRIDASAVDLNKFPRLSGVLDVIYNPLRTKLLSDADFLGIKCAGGLYMLVGQAVRAGEYFTGKDIDKSVTDKIYRELLSSKENIVLVGMPGSGKTTVGKLIAEKTGRSFFDADICLEERLEKKISDIFKESGEGYFRLEEANTVKELSALTSSVISTGGGVILNPENIKYLKMNGKIYFLDRDPNDIIPTSDRPTASDIEAVMKRYNERYEKYIKSADETIKIDRSAEEIADIIIGDHK